MRDEELKKNRRSLHIFIIVVLLIVLGALAVYYQFMKRQQMSETVHTPTTETEKLIARDLEMGYPETPKEVMKLFGRINQCIYNKDLSSENLSSLVGKLRELYCKELKDRNEPGKMEEEIRKEKDTYKSHKRKIINYNIDEESNYEYKKVKGDEAVYLNFSYFIRDASEYNTVNWFAILIKEDDKWKIREFSLRETQPQETAKNKK